MHLIRVGYRTVNLEYLIETIDSALGAPPDEAPPGKIRVSIYPGKVFDVGGEAAAQLRLHLDDNLEPAPAAAGAPGVVRQEPKRPARGRRGAPSRPSEPNPQEA